MDTDLILLTAAVVPDAAFRNALSEPEERLLQYKNAIKSWSNVASATGCRLIVVETSGAAGLLEDLAEIVSFTPSDSAIEAGKGAAEAEALEAGVRAANLKGGSTFHKVTGRLTLLNAKTLVRPATGGVRVRRRLDRSYVDTRFFSAKVAVWNEYLLGMATEVDDNNGRYLEHVMAQRLIRAEYAGQKVERFATRPIFSGSSGTNGKTYGSSNERLIAPVMLRFENLLSSISNVKQL